MTRIARPARLTGVILACLGPCVPVHAEVARVTVSAVAIPTDAGAIAVSAATGSYAGGSPCTVDAGARVTLVVMAYNDYRFAGWSGTGPRIPPAPPAM